MTPAEYVATLAQSKVVLNNGTSFGKPHYKLISGDKLRLFNSDRIRLCYGCRKTINHRKIGSIYCEFCADQKNRPRQLAAITAVNNAVRKGELPKITNDTKCVDCGGIAKVYDHRDYAFPLHVEPVCNGCNVRRGPGKNHI